MRVLFLGYYSSVENRVLCCSASVGEGVVHRLLFILERRLLCCSASVSEGVIHRLLFIFGEETVVLFSFCW